MYKVFIDHKPIIISENESYSQNHSLIKFIDSNTTHKVILHKLPAISLDEPLIVLCNNADDTFQELFKNHIKIIAAGGLVIKDGLILAIKRKGLWDIPKGKMEIGEEPDITAVREVEEECGIESPVITGDLVTTYHTYNLKGKDILKTTFWYTMHYDGFEELIPQLDEGISDVKWMSEKELLELRGNTYGSINEVIDTYFKSHG